MRINGADLHPEAWRIVRVANARNAGDEHRVATHHQGIPAGNGAYACEDCLTMFYDLDAAVQEDRPKDGRPEVDRAFLEEVARLAAERGHDLAALRAFIRWAALRHGIDPDGLDVTQDGTPPA